MGPVFDSGRVSLSRSRDSCAHFSYHGRDVNGGDIGEVNVGTVTPFEDAAGVGENLSKSYDTTLDESEVFAMFTLSR